MTPVEVFVLVDTLLELAQVGVLVLLGMTTWVIYRETRRLRDDLHYHRTTETHRGVVTGPEPGE